MRVDLQGCALALRLSVHINGLSFHATGISPLGVSRCDRALVLQCMDIGTKPIDHYPLFKVNSSGCTAIRPAVLR